MSRHFSASQGRFSNAGQSSALTFWFCSDTGHKKDCEKFEKLTCGMQEAPAKLTNPSQNL